MKPNRKSMCDDCPFSRESMRGWLGPHTPEELVEMAHGEAPFFCHKESSIQFDEGREREEIDVHQCAGFAIFRGNIYKRPYVIPGVEAMPPDREQVFAWNDEFIGHHTVGPFRSWELAEEDA